MKARNVFLDERVLKIAAPATLVFFLVFALAPAFLVPGNTLSFQLEVTVQQAKSNPLALAAMLVLAAGSSYVASIQWQLFQRRQKAVAGVQATGTVASGALAAVFATAACTSCLAALFPFLGAAAIVSLAAYQWQLVGIGFVLIGASLYVSVKQYTRLHKDK